MTARLVLFLSLLVALVAGCGGVESEPASSGTDVNTLLRDTFRNLDQIQSADLSAKLSVDGAGQSMTASLAGPFQSQGKGKLPKLQLDAKLQGGGQTSVAGVTWLGDKGYVNVQGTQYEVSGLVAKQLQAGYEEAAKQSKGSGSGLALGVDFSKWLKNGRNEGDADVAGTPTIKLTGEADVAQVIDDVQRLAERARSLNLPGTTQVPAKLTPQQRQQIVDSVKRFALEIYTGKQDRVLRKLVVNADLQDPASKQTSHVAFELTLTDVGGDQHFTAPTHARPFSELLNKADGLKRSLGLGAASSGSGAAAPSSDTIEKYAKCVSRAKGDPAKSQKCADLIGG